jgi:hypothetical protein
MNDGMNTVQAFLRNEVYLHCRGLQVSLILIKKSNNHYKEFTLFS